VEQAEKIETRSVKAMIDLVLQKVSKPWNMGIKIVMRQPCLTPKIGRISSIFNNYRLSSSLAGTTGQAGPLFDRILGVRYSYCSLFGDRKLFDV